MFFISFLNIQGDYLQENYFATFKGWVKVNRKIKI